MATNLQEVKSVDQPVYIGYTPDLTGFRYNLRLWYNSFIQSRTMQYAWSQVPTSDRFIEYCVKALRYYIHYCYGRKFGDYFRSESESKIRATCDGIYLPKFALQMIREVARHMYAGDVILFAYLPLNDAEGSGLVPGLGITPEFRSISTAFSYLECELLVQEECSKAPIFVANQSSIVWANGQTIPRWRLESICALKHLNRSCELIHGWRNAVNVPGNPVYVPLTRINVFDMVMPDPINFDGKIAAVNETTIQGVSVPIADLQAINVSQHIVLPFVTRFREQLHIADALLNDYRQARAAFVFSSSVFRLESIPIFVDIKLEFPSALNPSIVGNKAKEIGRNKKNRNKKAKKVKKTQSKTTTPVTDDQSSSEQVGD